MVLPINTAFVLSLPLLASGQYLDPEYVQFNGSSNGPHEGFETFQEADMTPNATHSVMFDASGRHWTWTLQTSEVFLLNMSNLIENAHVAYTTWHFTAEDSSDKAKETASSMPSCISLVDINFPSNVSNAWNSSSASCTSALGSECEQAILNHTYATDDCNSGDFVPTGQSFMDACSSAFGPDGYLTVAYPFNVTKATNGTFAWAISDPYNPDNSSSTFEAAKEKLRLMILTGEESNQVLCNRVSNENASDTSAALRSSTVSTALILGCSMLLGVAALWL